jgi:Domain of unknown function (DUF4349)
MRKMILAALLIALTSCKKEESGGAGLASSGAPDGVAQRTVAVAATPEPKPLPAEKGKVAEAAPLDRMIIRNATIVLIVRDTAKSIDAITAAIEQGGGYVSASNVWREGDVLHGKLTLRVPNAHLSTALGAIRAAGIRVQSESVTSEEVTQEYVDLSSQVRNLEATEEELRQLLVTVREHAKKASDILEVHEQLMTIRGQIEQAKGRMRYLEKMTAFATINVELTPDAVSTPAIEPGWQPLASVKEATRSLTNAGKAVVTAAIWIAIYVLPMLIVFAIALAIGWKVLAVIVRASRRRVAGSM